MLDKFIIHIKFLIETSVDKPKDESNNLVGKLQYFRWLFIFFILKTFAKISTPL